MVAREIFVNGTAHQVDCGGDRLLLELLRDDLGLTGPKKGCGEGACGACTVLIGQRPVTACTTPAAQALGQRVTTVEGLAEDGLLHPVQQAWLETGAMQCGYCTPGWLTATAALLARRPHPSDATIKAELAGHVCRCCAYPRILRAVHRAAELMDRPELLQPDPVGTDGPDSPATAGTSGRGITALLGTPEPVHPVSAADAHGHAEFVLRRDGLVMVAAPGADRAGPVRHRPGGAGAAWVHVGADGSVTAFTGKVEAGQGTRTALAVLVAEELAVRVDTVRVVMGDTRASPFDHGTFGSQSIPSAGPPLRAAAAGARALLIAEASCLLSLPAADLTVADGLVSGPGGRSVAYAQLLAGIRRIELVPKRQRLTVSARWQTAGCSAPAANGADIVTGRKRFPADLALDGMLHGCVLRPPAYGARLETADLAAAQAIPGAMMVRRGDFIGAVAADRRVAQQAITLIEATWSQAPEADGQNLAAYLRGHLIPAGREGGRFLHEQGSLPKARAAGPVHLQASYTAAFIAHVPLEPRCALATWRDDELTVWTGTSTPFGASQQVARMVDVPEPRVHVIVPDFGGGFGGKHGGDVAVEAALLARAAERPVKVQWSREEEFRAGYLRPAALIDVSSCATETGVITGWSLTNINSGSAGILSPYRIPHQRIEYQPAEPLVAQGSYRALAATANHFARESHVDEIAHRLGIDPLELRLRHLDDPRLAEVLRTVAERIGWRDRACAASADGTGVGIACGVEKGGRVATAAAVRVDADGSLQVDRLVTAFDCGAVVSPDGLTNQVEGAMMMALGGALFEQIEISAGRIMNASLAQYRVPRLADTPQVEVILVDRPDQPSAGGGETPMIAVAPAIANGIYDAGRIRVRSMPMAPDGIVRSSGSRTSGAGWLAIPGSQLTAPHLVPGPG